MKLAQPFALVLAVATPVIANAETESASARAARLAAADDTGALRDAAPMVAPTLSRDAVQTGNMPERTPVAEQAPQSTAPLTGALEELKNRQMEHNAPVFDRCVAAAKKKDPQLHGVADLTITVAQRKASLTAQSPNAALTSCLVTSAKTLRVSLPDTTFPWRISLGTVPAGATVSTLR
jgi:hypothetical protein